MMPEEADGELVRFVATESRGEVSGRLLMPDDATAIYVLAHGAGAGMDHPFLARMARELAARRVATLRYQFPYMERRVAKGGRGGRPDPPPIARRTVRSAVRKAAGTGLPVIAGGKSFGGRMTAQADAVAADSGGLADVVGLAFLGFPLHAPGRDGSERWATVKKMSLPTLFLQGDRDRLANLDLLAPLIADLDPPGRLHVVEGGDHSFGVLKRSGRSADDVFAELADTLVDWALDLVRNQ